MSTQAQYASNPVNAVAKLSAANTNRDGTGTVVNVITAGALGTRIDDVTIIATGTTTPGMVRLFLHDGTTSHLLREIPVTAATPTATVQTFAASLSNLGWVLQNGWSLRASTHNAESFNVLPTRAGGF